MDAALWSALEQALQPIGIEVDPAWQPKLTRYLELLLLWNRKINLTAVREPKEIVVKHFADSLAILPDVPAGAASLLDVGSGAGFPGAVIALTRPALAVTLLESNQKKAAFLSTVRRELLLANVVVVAERLEQQVGKRHLYDVVVSRAAIPLPGWWTAAKPLVAGGGTILAMEGSERTELPAGAVRREYPMAGAARAVVCLR